MNASPLSIRVETPADHRAAEELTREAFWNHHVPGCDEHYLLHVMRGSPAFLPSLAFVAELDGRMAGHIAYVKAYIEGDDGQRHDVLCFGPLSVHPDVQRSGVGRALVEHSVKAAREQGHSAILIMGDPAYYGRLGFRPAEDFNIRTADNLYLDPLQAMELVPGALRDKAGCFFEGEAYLFDPAGVAAFDADFPPRERVEGLPSQLRFQALTAMQKPVKKVE